MSSIQDEIQQQLDQIESDFDVKILLAVESGSRAWGFPSANSDYDVRFIYVHPTDWYLTIDLERKRDVIELPIDDTLDISGWDLRKALQLFRKSNPPLLEWLDSPIVYKEWSDVASRMRENAGTFYNPIACSYHYLHMAQGNHRTYLKSEQVWLKKYFYVLRPILAIKWIENGNGVAPMRFDALLERTLNDPALKQAIYQLIDKKKQGDELSYGNRIPIISDFIAHEMNRLANKKFDYTISKADTNRLNQLFRYALPLVQ